VRLNIHSYPKDLSARVAAALRQRKLPVPPSSGLDRLFEVLFFASIKADELRTTKVSVIALDPEAPDPSPPHRIRQDRWSYITLGAHLELSAGVLSKLSQATDPRSSSLAIWFKGARAYVWGLIDQQNGFFDYISHESESGPERLGLFQAVVTSPGWVTVYHEYERLAELRVNSISVRQPDVLWRGPIYSRLDAGILRYISRVETRLKRDDRKFRLTSEDHGELTSSWLQFHHGAAFLFTQSNRELNVKHSINYTRIANALNGIGYFQTKKYQTFERIDAVEKIGDTIPSDLHYDWVIAEDELQDSRSELDSAIWFVSLLSRIDGAVLLDFDMSVLGFGVEILTTTAPSFIFRASDAIGSQRRLQKVAYEDYGTRHRSMVRYCAGHPGAVGFVISQDGEVRAITADRDRVLLWDDIKLQLDFRMRPSSTGQQSA
jgi:hypothetical protein